MFGYLDITGYLVGIAVYSARIWIWLILEGMGYRVEVPMSRRSILGHTASQYGELRVYRSFPWEMGVFLESRDIPGVVSN